MYEKIFMVIVSYQINHIEAISKGRKQVELLTNAFRHLLLPLVSNWQKKSLQVNNLHCNKSDQPTTNSI